MGFFSNYIRPLSFSLSICTSIFSCSLSQIGLDSVFWFLGSHSVTQGTGFDLGSLQGQRTVALLALGVRRNAALSFYFCLLESHGSICKKTLVIEPR